MNFKKWNIYLIFSLIIVGCDTSLNFSNRSGTLDDDYVAEPISDISEKYKEALEVSNNLIESIKNNQLRTAYDKYFSSSIKPKMSFDSFSNLIGQMQKKVGALTSYKPMQWGFFSGKEQNMNLFYSVKIAEHDKTMMKYLFVFNSDGNFDQIVGFHVKIRQGVSPPGVY